MLALRNILLLTTIILSFSSCGQESSTGETALGMVDYFDEDGEILVKLYKDTDQGKEYWESWNISKNKAVTHWGKLGETGQKNVVSAFTHKGLKEDLNKLIDQRLKDGYREIPMEEQYTVIVTFKLDNWGSPSDLDRREELRSILTEHLGWTGNGRCDDGDIGSGEMALFADVVDPYLAIKTITKEFEAKGIIDKHYFSIMQGDSIIEQNVSPKIK